MRAGGDRTPAPREQGRLGRRSLLRAGRSRAAAATASQVLVAGSSFALQLVAARTLGATGLGRFTLLTSVLIAWNALHTGWIGDSLTVLDRFDPGLRAALVRSQFLAAGLGFVVASGIAATFGLAEPETALVFGLATALWGLEDTCRRLLMARFEFWQLVVNDAVYALAATAVVAGVVLSGRAVSLATLIWAVAAGAGCAVVAGALQLPARELRPGPRGRPDLRVLSTFAVWRAAQVGVAPTAQFLLRALVAALASTSALGRLEAARLLVAPMQALTTGAGTLLLPVYADAVRRGAFSVRAVHRAIAVLVGGALVVGGVAVVAAGPLSPLVSGRAFEIEPASVAAWALLVAAMGAGVPASLAVVAHQRARLAFLTRATTAVLGLVVSAVVVAVGVPTLAPLGLAAGTAGTALWLLRALEPSDGRGRRWSVRPRVP